MQASSKKAEVSPVLKMVLELGPLVVFFLANRYGEELAAAWKEAGYNLPSCAQ